MSHTNHTFERRSYSWWLKDWLRNRGLFATGAHLLRGAFTLLRDSLPSRRRMRYGDIQFDFDHSVDTTWANISFRTRAAEILIGGQYQATDPLVFQELMGSLDVDCSEFVFIDLGSGKGRVLLMASEYPFKRIIGVEILSELNAIAQQNISKYVAEGRKCSQIESVCMDAREFEFPKEPLFVFVFNPFPEHVLRTVLENLENSVRENRRRVYLVFHNLLYESLLVHAPSFSKIGATERYVVFAGGG